MDMQTILVIDDDVEAVESLRQSLRAGELGFRFIGCHDGQSALDILVEETPEIMVLSPRLPGLNGFDLLDELQLRGIWCPCVVISDAKIDEAHATLTDFGIVDFFLKPFTGDKAVSGLEKIIKNLKKRDIIKNFSLPSILQLIEMEKRTGILTIRIGTEDGRLFFSNGRAMDIEVKGLSSDDAKDAFLLSLYEDRDIIIEYIPHRKAKKVNMSLMHMVMEASRIKDEKLQSRNHEEAGIEPESQDITESNDLPGLTLLLESLKEVENYIIVDPQGDVLAASHDGQDEEVLNTSFFLWATGRSLGELMRIGEPGSLACYFKTSRRIIRGYKQFIIIIQLAAITKYSAFKNKLDRSIDELSVSR